MRQDHRGIRHSVDVEAETLYEAAVHGVCQLSADPWLEKIVVPALSLCRRR